jgi:hypothetical protein
MRLREGLRSNRRCDVSVLARIMEDYAFLCIYASRRNALYSAPIRATSVKRAYEPNPVTTCGRQAGLTILLGPSSQVPGSSRRAARGQAGAPAAAQRRGRTSLTAASGGRSSRARKVSVAAWGVRGRVGVPGVVGGVVSQAPIRRRASVRAAAMTICPGPGCSVR